MLKRLGFRNLYGCDLFLNRILKKGGMLLTSSDYWPNKLVNKIIYKDIRKMSPNNVFSKEEIEKNVIDVAEQNGFSLTEPIDFTHEQLMQNVTTSLQHMMEGGSSSDVVAKVVHKAVTSENPSLRYFAGKDVETWLDGKRNMSDEEFYKMMKQNLMK